jgi:hypothetical protein
VKLLKSIRDFSYGLVDSFGRGKEPEGSFVDSRNLIPTKIGSLETVHGYAATNVSSHIASTTALPTGFPDVSGTGTYDVSEILADPFCYSSESPISYDGRVYWIKDSDTTKHIMLDTWFKGSTTKQASYVMLDERKVIAYSADVAISGTTEKTIVIANAAAKGLSASNDYYNGWRIDFYDDSGATTEYAYVKDYGVSADTATITLLDDVGSSYLAWNIYAVGDILTLRRWFHSQANFVPDFATPPGKPFESQGVVRGCGGAASTANYEPYWVGYINRTFFTGVTGGALAYQGTYADILEARPSMDFEGTSGIAAQPLVTYAASASDAAKNFSVSAIYKIGYTLEYDGYQESRIFGSYGPTTAGTNYLQYKLAVRFATMNKRVTAINIYARQYLGGIYSEYYHVRRIDIVTPASGEETMWAFQAVNTPGSGDETVRGYFTVDGTTAGNTIAQLSESDWANKGQSYFDRNGRNEEDTTYQDRHVVAWQYTEVLAGRRFYGYFYDYDEAALITDFVRFTGFGLGVPNYDIIPSDRLNYEFEVATGDPGTINGLMSDKGFLYTFKDDSIHSTYINANPETWVHQVVSNQDGLYAVKSLVRLPDGGICFADADHYKLLLNQRVIPLTAQIRDTYYALTGKASIISWYDKIDGAVCFTNGVDSTGYTHYRGYKTAQGMAWYKIVLPSTDYPEFIGVERDESIIFTHSSTFQGLFKWARTAYTFDGIAIIPYFKTNNVILSESAYTLLDKIVFTKSGNATAGTLQTRVYVDGTLSQAFTAEDKTMETLYQKLRATSSRQGRRIQVEYNYHSSGESLSTAKLQLDGIDIYGEVLVPPEKSV